MLALVAVTLGLVACGAGESGSERGTPPAAPGSAGESPGSPDVRAAPTAPASPAEPAPPAVPAPAGNDGAAESVAAVEFAAAVAAICARSRERLDAMGEPETSAAGLASKVAEIHEEELRLLGELVAPDELASRFDGLMSLRREQITALARLAEARGVADQDAADEALRDSARLTGALEMIALELGLEVCGRQPVEETPNQQRQPDTADAPGNS